MVDLLSCLKVFDENINLVIVFDYGMVFVDLSYSIKIDSLL